MSATRLVTLEDAARLAGLLEAHREFFAPWDPVRPEEYFTEEGQRAVVGGVLEQHAQGQTLPHVVLDESGQVVGRITLSEIVRGPFQSCRVGYWVSPTANGRGLATAAVAEIVRVAFEDLGLHRVEAGTLLHNVRSQRVLRKNGFVPVGVAQGYLRIAGEWQDHLIFQRIDA